MKARGAILLALALAGCGEQAPDAPTPTATEATLHILLLNRLGVFAEGIPCNGENIPPLAAAAAVKRRLQDQGDGVILVCVGDTMANDAGQRISRMEQAVVRARTGVILQAMASAGVDLYVPGAGDLDAGPIWLIDQAEQQGVPILMSNTRVEERPDLPLSRHLQRAGLDVACVGIVPMRAVSAVHADESLLIFSDADETAGRIASESRAAGQADFVVVFSTLNNKENQKFLMQDGVNLVVGSSDNGTEVAPVVFVGKAGYVSAKPAGQELGQTTMHVVGGNFNLVDISSRHVLPERIAPIRAQIDELAATYGTHDVATLARLVAVGEEAAFLDRAAKLSEYETALASMTDFQGSYLDHQAAELLAVDSDDAVMATLDGIGPAIDAALADESLPPGAEALPSLIPPPEACASCHPTQYRHWQTTSHSRAYDRLVAMGREHDPSCLPCHATGWGVEGGYNDPRLDAPYGGVSCYACHKATTMHYSTVRMTLDPLYAENGQKGMTCSRCHGVGRSPDFDQVAAMKRVACPRIPRADPALQSTFLAALEHFEHRRETDKSTLRDQLLEGRARTELGQPEGVQMLRDAALSTNESEDTLQISRILDRHGDSTAAVDVLRRFITNQPGAEDVNREYLRLLLEASDPEARDPNGVLTRLQFILSPEMDPEVLATWKVYEVDALFQLGRLPKARTLLNELAEAFGDNPLVRQRVERWKGT